MKGMGVCRFPREVDDLVHGGSVFFNDFCVRKGKKGIESDYWIGFCGYKIQSKVWQQCVENLSCFGKHK